MAESVDFVTGHDAAGYNTFTLRENCLYLEFFWSPFFRIRTEYREILQISPYSV